MYCGQCGNEVNENAAVCLECGCAVDGAVNLTSSSPKSRVSYVLLGSLLGLIGLPGIHNLYAGRQSQGLIQLVGTILTCWILWIPMYIWTIVEVCTVTCDGDGNPMT